MTDLRKEQLFLLRFEKQIAGLAAVLAAGGAAAAKIADGKLHASEGAQGYAQIEAALVNLAAVTAEAHMALNAKAMEAGALMFEAAGGGRPKHDLVGGVRSILGIG